MLYFAYGSNMCIGKLENSLGNETNPTFVRVAKISGYKLKFHKKSTKDGSGKANAFKTDNLNDVVYGVVFDIEDSQIPNLDKSEGGYKREEIKNMKINGKPVHTYFAENDKIDDSLKPYSWYLRFVLEGARKYNDIPENYIKDNIENVETIKDLDKKREARKNKILCQEY